MNTDHVTERLKGEQTQTLTPQKISFFPTEKQVGSTLTVSFCKMVLPTKTLSAIT
jgi:hypothetical protein